MTEPRKTPPAWVAWGTKYGSATLKRAISEGWPYRSMLKRELIAHVVRPIEGTERDDDIGEVVRWGPQREPNAASFALRDRIVEECKNTILPEATFLTIGAFVRVTWQSQGGLVKATGVQILIVSREDNDGGETLAPGYIWGRNDRPAEGGSK